METDAILRCHADTAGRNREDLLELYDRVTQPVAMSLAGIVKVNREFLATVQTADLFVRQRQQLCSLFAGHRADYNQHVIIVGGY